MDVIVVGKKIAEVRRKCGMTQEQLAVQVGVTVQAVSKWENGKNLPDIENLMRIAEITDMPYQTLLEAEKPDADMKIRTRLFHEENMLTRVKTFALSENLQETYRAVQFMRDAHAGQYRKKAKFASELVEYINHPLMMACHAHAMGIRDDAVLAAVLLHDVVEDTEYTLEELPFSDEVKELVNLLTHVKGQGNEEYFGRIAKNGKACLIKVLDRCNNVSTMAASFSREKLISYIEETETYILPLADILKHEYPVYGDAAFILKYQIIALIETMKNLLAG